MGICCVLIYLCLLRSEIKVKSEEFPFERSKVFQSRIYYSGWKMWHDPNSLRNSTNKWI